MRRPPDWPGEARMAVMLTATLASSEQICASAPGLLSLRITNCVTRIDPPFGSERKLTRASERLHVNHVRAIPERLRDAARLARGHDDIEVRRNRQQLQHPGARARLD